MVCRNLSAFADAPRAGGAEAKTTSSWKRSLLRGCIPCRQRRGKGTASRWTPKTRLMHPVQAAPRQSALFASLLAVSVDAPRAGSAKQNNNVPPDGPLTTGRHFFTFHPSRILTLLLSTSVTMYNPVPIFLTDPAWQSRIFPTVPMLSVTGRPRGFSWCGGSPWE